MKFALALIGVALGGIWSVLSDIRDILKGNEDEKNEEDNVQ